MSDNDSASNNSQEPLSEDWLKQAADWWSQALSEAGAGFRARMDAAAKLPPPDVAPTPPTKFDRHFQQLVPPKLEGYVRLGAYMVRLGLESFTEAHNRVMRVAVKYGATHLSDTAFYALDDWIDQQILACIDEPAPEGLVSPERLARITGEPR